MPLKKSLVPDRPHHLHCKSNEKQSYEGPLNEEKTPFQIAPALFYYFYPIFTIETQRKEINHQGTTSWNRFELTKHILATKITFYTNFVV